MLTNLRSVGIDTLFWYAHDPCAAGAVEHELAIRGRTEKAQDEVTALSSMCRARGTFAGDIDG